ncbi:hypothetical protein Angca_000116 [Angiostrongylus cantonensis]|nr:hypothetical protein Angca_000116 [Angiostrongylus cantonensis]
MGSVAEQLRVYSLLFTLLLRSVLSLDVFCGPLDIFEQQRFGSKSVALSSQETTDLKHCLELCCSVLKSPSSEPLFSPVLHRGRTAAQSRIWLTMYVCYCMEVNVCLLNIIVDCRGVTFTGVIAPHVDEPNCLLVGCSDDQCEMNERAEYPDGLVSVAINRTQVVAVPVTSTQKTLIMTDTLAPVWAVGLGIVIAVTCVGLNLGLLSAYICYRRQRSHKHIAHISANKGPRLHAYNPTI